MAQPNHKRDRNDVIWELWVAGNTHGHIAKMFGISQQRVHQIVNRHPNRLKQKGMRNRVIQARVKVDNRWRKDVSLGYQKK